MEDASREAEIAAAIEEHTSRNTQLRARFEELSLDFEELRPVEFHFLAWSQRDAAVLARHLYGLGLLLHLLGPAPTEEDEERWVIEAGARITLEQALDNALAEKLVRLANQEDSVFDGWLTSY